MGQLLTINYQASSCIVGLCSRYEQLICSQFSVQSNGSFTWLIDWGAAGLISWNHLSTVIWLSYLCKTWWENSCAWDDGENSWGLPGIVDCRTVTKLCSYGSRDSGDTNICRQSEGWYLNRSGDSGAGGMFTRTTGISLEKSKQDWRKYFDILNHVRGPSIHGSQIHYYRHMPSKYFTSKRHLNTLL